MSENRLLDLSFAFAVAIVNLVDGIMVPKSVCMSDQLNIQRGFAAISADF